VVLVLSLVSYVVICASLCVLVVPFPLTIVLSVLLFTAFDCIFNIFLEHTVVVLMITGFLNNIQFTL